MAMTIEPCPFCGNRDVEIHHGASNITFLLCGDDVGRGGCGAVVSFRPNLKGSAAVHYYNRRAHLSQPALAVDVDSLYEVIRGFGYTTRGQSDEIAEAVFEHITTRALAGEKAEGWRDIATAPKDGTRVLLANGHGVWMADYQPVYPSGYRPSNPWSSVLLNHEHMPLVGRHKAPTHWMPLPTPPTDGEE